LGTEEVFARLDRVLPLLLARIAHQTRVPGLGPAAMATLRKLKLSSVCTVSELAEWMGVTSATVTGITNKLVSQHLVERWREESDRRVVRLRLTSEGSEVLSRVERLRREKTSRLLMNLQEEDLRKLADILEKLVVTSNRKP